MNISDLDIIRCLRNRKAYGFIEYIKTPLSGGPGVAVLVPAINKAWSMAPDSLSYLTNDMIVSYLPTEMSDESSNAVVKLLDNTSIFYETEKALKIAYAIVSSRKLAVAVEKVFQESKTPIELGQDLRLAFQDLAQIELHLKRRLDDYDEDNFLSLTSSLVGSSLRSSKGASRIIASVGGALDVSLGGGLEEGTYTIFLGSKGEGKTWSAACVAARNARVGRNSLFFTLENSKYSISERTTPLYLECPFFVTSFRTFRQTLIKTGVDYIRSMSTLEAFIVQHVKSGLIWSQWKEDLLKRFSSLKPKFPMSVFEVVDLIDIPFHQSMDIIIDHKRSQLYGDLDIYFYPSNTIKVSDIEQKLESSDKEYKLVVVDYLNAIHVPPNVPRHEFLGFFADECRRLAGQYGCAFWINAQLKRGFKMFSKTFSKVSGLDEDVFYEFVAESFKAVWGADYVMVLVGMSGAGMVQISDKKGVIRNYDRMVHLNRARESMPGDWFGWYVDQDSGLYEVVKRK